MVPRSAGPAIVGGGIETLAGAVPGAADGSTVPVDGPAPSGRDVLAVGTTTYLTHDHAVLARRPSGALEAVAGIGAPGYAGDGGPATAATLNGPAGLAIDTSGRLLIADSGNHVVRRVDLVTGTITTIAGTGVGGYTGNGAPATSARLDQPVSLAVGSTGDVFIGERGNHVVRRIDHATGVLSVYAGPGTGLQPLGDGGPAIGAWLNVPESLAVDAADNLFIADRNDARLRRVDGATKVITTVGGKGVAGVPTDGWLATATPMLPWDVAVEPGGSLLVSVDGQGTIGPYLGRPRLVRIAAGTPTVSTVAGGAAPGSLAEGGSPLASEITGGTKVDRVADGSLVLVTSRRLRTIDSGFAVIATVAGDGTSGGWGDGGPATSAGIRPSGVAVAPDGDVFVADQLDNVVRRIDATTGEISRVAGTGAYGSAGDGGPATAALLANPADVAVTAGHLYIADSGRLRRVDLTTGTIETAVTTSPRGLAVDHAGRVLVATPYDILRFDPTTVDLATLVASGPSDGPGVPGGPVVGQGLDAVDVAELPDGDVAWSEDWSAGGGSAGQRVRRADLVDRTVTTMAGGSTAGFSGDGGPATAAKLAGPESLVVASDGDLLIADTRNQRIRQIDGTTGIITTVAGAGALGTSPDGTPAATAMLADPRGLAVDDAGGIVLAVTNRVRRIPALGPERLTPIAPTRVLDSRDGTGGSASPWGAGETRTVAMAGGGTGVPPDADAVLVNLTAVLPSAPTHLTVWEAGTAEPGVSNLNVPAGAVRPNLVFAELAADGTVSIANNSGSVHLVGDVVAYRSRTPGTDRGGLIAITPTRVLDSRDGTGGWATPWPATTSRTVSLDSAVPADAVAVVVNLTATRPTAATHLTVSPAGSAPLASNLNVAAGETAANLVVVPLGVERSIALYNNSGSVHVIADLVGYVSTTSAAELGSVTPKRVADSRDGTGTSASRWGAGESRTIVVRGGTTGVGAGADAVLVNLTAVLPSQATHLTAWPAGVAVPLASNLNLPAGDVRANLALVPVGTADSLAVANNSGTTDVIVDVMAASG
ncbi:MAG: hypothetical protein U0Q07_20990 [Acidimicrobiales bacterium]